MQKTLKALSALLQYPEAPLIAALSEIRPVLSNDRNFDAEDRNAIRELVDWLEREDLIDAQIVYGDTFDRGRKRSLYLFEHVHGESRDRGQAMVDLRNAYRDRGLELDANELPDYLPLFLEFCGHLESETATEWLHDVSHILQRLYLRLQERESPYSGIMRLLLRLSGDELMPEALRRELADEQRDDTPDALDKVWAETPVTFGPSALETSCPSARPQPGNPNT